MFSLFYGLWKYIFSKTEFHVLILGIDKAGKTTLLEKLKTMYSESEGLPPDRIVPTVGLNIARGEASKSKLVFWDLGGQQNPSILWGISRRSISSKTIHEGSMCLDIEENRVVAERNHPLIWTTTKLGLRTIWEKYYEEAHAVMYVVDAACQSRFEDTKSALEKALRHEDLQGAPILIFANKQDISGAVSAEELARYLDLKELNERPYMYQAISAFDGSGIREGVNWLVDAMRRSKRSELLRHRADMAMVVAV